MFSPNKAKTLVSYLLYINTNHGLNKIAKTFFHKAANNPHQAFYTNQNFTPKPDDINDINRTAPSQINYHDVSYLHQPRVFDCVDTSVEMLMRYHKQKCMNIGYTRADPFIEEFERNFSSRKINLFSGKGFDDVKKYCSMLNVADYSHNKRHLAFSIEELAYHLYEKGPIVMSTNDIGGHLLLLKGIVGDNVIIHDPWDGPNITCSFEKFKKRWSGVIISFPGGYSKALEHELEKSSAQEMSALLPPSKFRY